MARGWESKSVEQQQEQALTDTGQRRQQLTAEQIAKEQRKIGLELSRKRMLQQLELATNPRHREMIEVALKELEAELKDEA
jgi:hypothetical protein